MSELRANADVAPLRLTAILTSFNRAAATVECLRRLEIAASRARLRLDAVLVDDASTDGTAAEVKARFPWVTVVSGDGSLFWCRGMHRAQALAMRRDIDALLWINDDTHLADDALLRMLDTQASMRASLGRPVIVVGATADLETGALTYGGLVSAGRLRRLSYHRVVSETTPVECEAMNGNLVLVPVEIARAVGNFDPEYEHAMGDIDYALRARKAGYRIFVAPGFVGHCAMNSRVGTFHDVDLPLAQRWNKILSRKGLPLRSWWRFTRRHGGPAWPLYFVWPYLRLIVSSLRRRNSACANPGAQP